MHGNYRLLRPAASFSPFASVGTAFALPECFPHDRLTRKVNATDKTQFHTNCVTLHLALRRGH